MKRPTTAAPAGPARVILRTPFRSHLVSARASCCKNVEMRRRSSSSSSSSSGHDATCRSSADDRRLLLLLATGMHTFKRKRSFTRSFFSLKRFVLLKFSHKRTACLNRTKRNKSVSILVYLGSQHDAASCGRARNISIVSRQLSMGVRT